MSIPTFHWPAAPEFRNRFEEIRRLDDWWNSDERMPLSVFGRRRVGKSWLLRRFADGRPAIFLQAERLTAGAQLTTFAGQLEAIDGQREAVADVPSLFRRLFRLGQNEKFLAVIDEFPWLLDGTESLREQTLSGIQAVMEEERDGSNLKLILCGSAVDQMEALQKERNPLHGRLIPLEIKPLNRLQASLFLEQFGAVEALTRFAIAGGMPRYLKDFGGESLRDVVCRAVLQPTSALWNEGRTIVEQELSEPETYMAIIDRLARNPQTQTDLSSRLGIPEVDINSQLGVLEDMRIVRKRAPLGAPPNFPKPQWSLEDPFLRFWFRFVYPFQADLEGGLKPEDLWSQEIEPNLAHHVAPIFEEECRIHARRNFGHLISHVGSWWGNAVNDLRQKGERTSEEIDVVGVKRNKIHVVGEAKWTSSPMSASILRELREFKIPALNQDGFALSENAIIVLYSRSGYGDLLEAAAANDSAVILVTPQEMFAIHEAVD